MNSNQITWTRSRQAVQVAPNRIRNGKSARRQKSGFTAHSRIEVAAGVCRYESRKRSELLHCPSHGRNLCDLLLACQKSDSGLAGVSLRGERHDELSASKSAAPGTDSIGNGSI